MTINLKYLPGSITVDTAGGCTHPPSSGIIDPSNGATPGIRAADEIRSHALQLGSPNVGPTFATSIDPQLTPGPFITRQPIDHRYNCMIDYPTDQIWSPAAHPQLPDAVQDCELTAEDASPAPYIQSLVSAYQSVDAGSLPSADWSVYPGDLTGVDASCDGQGSSSADFDLGPSHARGAGNGRFWFVDCGTLDPKDIRFIDVEAVVTRGPVTVTSNDRMTVQGNATTGAVFYVQDGEFRRQGAQSEVVLEDTFVYLHDGPARMISGNQAELTWNAPTLDMADDCPSAPMPPGVPNAACFAPLALWSNSVEQHEIGGSPTLDVIGTFFTPNAEYWLHGGGGQDLRGAQFFTRRLKLNGNTTVVLEPNPNTNVAIPLESRDGLIR